MKHHATKHRATKHHATAPHTNVPVPHHSRPDSGDAFIEDPSEGSTDAPDEVAELLAEGFVLSATSGQELTADEDKDPPTLREVGLLETRFVRAEPEPPPTNPRRRRIHHHQGQY